MRLFLAEKLASSDVSTYSRFIQLADLCWALRLENGSVALPVLEDQKWQTGDAPLIESFERRLAAWAGRLAISQKVGGRTLRSTEQALLTYGLWARLWAASLGVGLVRYSALMSGTSLEELDLDIAGDDPYLRDAFTHKAGIRGEVKSVRLHTARPSLPLRQRIKEMLIGNTWVRAMSCRYNFRKAGSVSWFQGSYAERNPKTAAIFVLNQRFLDVSAPVLRELELRGWHVCCFYYNAPTSFSKGAVSFDEAAGPAGGLTWDRIPSSPRWRISDEMLCESPVSRAWLKVALDASWLTGEVQVARHRRVLESLRPDVILTLGPETMSLALQDAAGTLGIPTVFLAHGFLGPMPQSFYFTATASALLGQVCVQENQKIPDEARRRSLVATGHMPYDAMLARSCHLESHRSPLPDLEMPAERPYIVLFFATWANQPLWCALQQRALKMLAHALPKDAFLLCKLHPSCEEREMCEALLGASLPRDAFQVIGEGRYRTPDLLAACHVAVANELSMELRDALVMGRPAIAIMDPSFPRREDSCNPLNHPGSDFKGACCLVSNEAELRQALFLLTRDTRARNDLLRHRKAYIEQFLVAADGRSTHRVADLVEHLAAGKACDSFISTIGQSLVPEA